MWLNHIASKCPLCQQRDMSDIWHSFQKAEIACQLIYCRILLEMYSKTTYSKAHNQSGTKDIIASQRYATPRDNV